jgi:hypothetical protein
MSALGGKRTWRFALHMSAYDPKRTLLTAGFLDRNEAGGCSAEHVSRQDIVVLSAPARLGRAPAPPSLARESVERPLVGTIGDPTLSIGASVCWNLAPTRKRRLVIAHAQS